MPACLHARVLGLLGVRTCWRVWVLAGSARLRAWYACVLTCSRTWGACVHTCSRDWRAHVLTSSRVLYACLFYVLACSHVLHACCALDVMCLRTCVLLWHRLSYFLYTWKVKFQKFLCIKISFYLQFYLVLFRISFLFISIKNPLCHLWRSFLQKKKFTTKSL